MHNSINILAHEKFYAITQELMFCKLVSAEAKLFFVYIADKISYSQFFDDRGQYFYLTSSNRKELLASFGWSESKFCKITKELKNNNFINSRQIYSGVRFYLTTMSDSQKCKTEIIENNNPGLLKTQNPINYTNRIKPIKLNNSNYSESIFSTYTSISSNKSENFIPTKEEVEQFFIENKYTQSAEKFFCYYDQKNWTCNDQPIKDWKKLAYVWVKNQFISLPHQFYTPAALSYYEQLPEYVVEQIIKDQQDSKSGDVRVSTLELIQSFLQIY